MNLYLNDKERKILLLKLFEDLLHEVIDRYKIDIYRIKDIYKVIGTYDPVLEFIEYYCTEFGVILDTPTKKYIANLLYAAKGTNEIEHILTTYLGNEANPASEFIVQIEYPIIKKLGITNLSSADPIKFATNLQNMIYNLVFYSELTTILVEVILKLESEVTSTNSIHLKWVQEVTQSVVSDPNFYN